MASVIPRKRLRVEVISTGNELLDGSIVDSNSQRLAKALQPLGMKIGRITIVPDSVEAIRNTLTLALARSDLVFMSGGLGPTSDDLSVQVTATTFGLPLILSSAARKNVLNRMKRMKRVQLLPGHQRQFLIPKGAEVLRNEQGTAPGLQITLGDRVLFLLPGVPREYEFILKDSVVPYLEKHRSRSGKFLIIYKIFGWPESRLDQMVHRMKLPKEIEVGFRTHFPENHIKFSIEASSEAAAQRILKPIDQELRKKLGDSLFAVDSLEASTTFSENVFKILLQKKYSVALAESCTGGLATSMLTAVSGSSKVLDRSFVTYSNRSKMELLGVSEKTLEKHGAVSKETVVEMARGARNKSNVDRAIAITGIAGPTGGSSQKPVGTIWIGLATKKGVKTRRLQLGFDRELNQKYSAYQALSMLANDD